MAYVKPKFDFVLNGDNADNSSTQDVLNFNFAVNSACIGCCGMVLMQMSQQQRDGYQHILLQYVDRMHACR